MPDPHRLGNVGITPYDARWPDAYRAEEARLIELAERRFLHIEHFGSTAIPGLSAKPTIDIMAAVQSLESLTDVIPRLGADGYRELSENFSYRRFFRKAACEGCPSTHLHVVPEGAWPNKSERFFRDWLITHPERVEAYGRLKTTLATRFPDDRERYNEAKSEFIRGVVNEARRSSGLEPLIDWTE